MPHLVVVFFVLDPSGLILAGPPDQRHLLTRSLVERLAFGESVQVDGHEITSMRVDDPSNPWLIVRLEPRAASGPRATTVLTLPLLTDRQLEVARLAALGHACHEIGHALGCATNTVRSHLRNIYERLAVSNRVELSRALAELGPDG